MEGLTDEPRPGSPRKITDAKVEEAVTQTLESLPRAATHWSTRSLAAKVGLSQSAVVRIWHSFGLQPHRSETFKLSTDPLLVEKIRDIVGLYLNPPEHAVVLCVDEKSQVQALDRTGLFNIDNAGVCRYAQRGPRVKQSDTNIQGASPTAEQLPVPAPCGAFPDYRTSSDQFSSTAFTLAVN